MVLLLHLAFLPGITLAQTGHLLIVGGGTEYNDTPRTWNHDAYQWAVDHAPNKKVAVLHYSSGSDWLEDYFVNHCGAAEAESYIVGSGQASNDALMETLEGYDMFFLRGGNQWRYYDYWRDSKIATLLEQKFNGGAVLAGTSAGLAVLSGVVYTAENASAYTDYSIKNIDHSSHTLEDDFLQVAPGYLFDSHFTDRGRMGRLVAFMAKWNKDRGEIITGIGVDESTAFAIHASGMGYAFGTGAVNILRPSGEGSYGNGPLLSVDSLEITQLLHGDSINLETMVPFGQASHPDLDPRSDWPNQTVYLSGTETLNGINQEMLEQLSTARNGKDDPIVIITGTSSSLANNYKNYLVSEGAENVSVYQGLSTLNEDPAMEADISMANKFLFIENNAFNLGGFLYSGGNGNLLLQKINTDGVHLYFAGDNARFAGHTIVANYNTPNASENNALSLSEGFNVLPQTVIIPHTLMENQGGGSVTDTWHTTFASLPYALVSDDVPLGIWLNNENGVIIEPQNQQAQMTTCGFSPVITLTWPGGGGDLSQQTFKGEAAELPRQIGGFYLAYLSFLEPGITRMMGDVTVSADDEVKLSGLRAFPNPASSFLRVSVPSTNYHIQLYTLAGKEIYRCGDCSWLTEIPVNGLCSGMYLLSVRDNANQITRTTKICIRQP